jgi:hypothetical protein
MIAVIKNTISKGMRPTFSARLQRRMRTFEDEVVSSFCTSRANRTRIPISATEPAKERVIIVEIVAVVMVEIMMLYPS